MHNATATQQTANPVNGYANEYIGTAYDIGKTLVRDAIWHEGRCNWLGAAVEPVNGRFDVVQRSFGPDLYNGTVGVALFLAQLYLRTNDAFVLKTLNGAVNNALALVDREGKALETGLYSGKLGIGATIYKIGWLLNDQAMTQQGFDIVNRLTELKKFSDHEVDVVSGAAGAVPVLISMYRQQNHKPFLDLAVRLGEFIVSKAVRHDDNAIKWPFADAPGLTGYSHGSSGMALALLELGQVSGRQDFMDAASAAFAFERLHFNQEEGNWPDLREMPAEEGAAPQKMGCGHMWCHGAPGIALTRLKAFQLTSDQSYLSEAQVALETTARSVSQSLAMPQSANFSLCHGLAGNADILLYGGTVLNRQDLVNIAYQTGRVGIELYGNTNTRWPSGVNDPTGKTAGMEPTPGLMLGAAGTGLFYLRLADPANVNTVLIDFLTEGGNS